MTAFTSAGDDEIVVTEDDVLRGAAELADGTLSERCRDAADVLASIRPIIERERRDVLRRVRSGCGCIAHSVVNADIHGCYCDCAERGYTGCDHEIERGVQ